MDRAEILHRYNTSEKGKKCCERYRKTEKYKIVQKTRKKTRKIDNSEKTIESKISGKWNNIWEHQEIMKLINMKEKNYTNREISNVLNRTIKAIEKRITILNKQHQNN
jgi:hypothetical protein